MKTTGMQPWTMAAAIALALGACATGTQHDQAALNRSADAAKAVPRDDGIAAMDEDSDGRLTTTEHARGARTMFVEMDTDHDEQVTAAEMDAKHAAADTLSQPGRMPLTSAQKIAVIDADGDGKLSAAEHAAGTLQMFAKMDGDRDGYLTAAEMQAGHDAMLSAPERRTAAENDE